MKEVDVLYTYTHYTVLYPYYTVQFEDISSSRSQEQNTNGRQNIHYSLHRFLLTLPVNFFLFLPAQLHIQQITASVYIRTDNRITNA